MTVDQSRQISQVFSKQQSSVTIFHQIKASTTVQDGKHHIHHHRSVFGRIRVSFRFVGFGRVIIVILGFGFWKEDVGFGYAYRVVGGLVLEL